MSLIEPSALPSASSADVGQLLSRLLELHAEKQLTSLSDQCLEAISSLPTEDRPTSYEGLLDVARYCIDEEPGWDAQDKAVLLSGHPRIGQPAQSTKEGMSESSRAEQRADTADDASDQRACLCALSLSLFLHLFMTSQADQMNPYQDSPRSTSSTSTAIRHYGT